MSADPNLDLSAIERVEFYKRDELTTDLICCDVMLDGVTRLYHEEMPIWRSLLDRLQLLQGFRADWFALVSQPPFADCRLTAYEKPNS